MYKNDLLWFNQSNINSKGDSLLSLIEKSLFYGLIPQHYHLSQIKNNIDSIHTNKEVINVTALLKADFY